MSGGLAGGVMAAVAAACLYGSAPVAQSVAAARVAPGRGAGLGLTARLARQPVWLIGLACDIAAFVLEAVAFSAAPATLVVPVTSCDMVVFVLLGGVVLGERPTGRVVGGVAAMGGGVALLALAFDSDVELGAPASDVQMVTFLAVCVVAVVLAVVLGARAMQAGRQAGAAVLFSVAAGVSYGMATLATRQLGRTASGDGLWNLLAGPTPYVLAICSVLAIGMMQRGLQTKPVLAYPIASVVSAFLPVVVGATMLNDQVPAGGRGVMFVAALALVGVGLILLGRDRRAV